MPVQRTCLLCAKQFTTKPYRIAQGRARYCSRGCYYRAKKMPVAIRFQKYIGPADENGCLPWVGQIDSGGYGIISVDSYPHLAHRVAWELANGPIPDSLHVLHRCDYRRCINVSHLFLGTNTQNSADAIAKRRLSHGERHHAAKLSLADVLRIRERYANGQATRPGLAAEYGVHLMTIHRIIHKETWKQT